jgi:carbon monoxide dehydrogenase subunit G
MKIEDSFEVQAPIEATWDLLNDVPAVIPCMPGAELVETRGSDEWLARLATKIGPMAMKFDAEVSRTKRDADGRSVELTTSARELKGRGKANATIASTLEPNGGGTKVLIVTDLQLQGPVAQFGRGVVAEISAQMTQQFAAALAARLSPPEGADGDAAAPAPVESKPVPALRLLMIAIWRWFKGLFRRGKS